MPFRPIKLSVELLGPLEGRRLREFSAFCCRVATDGTAFSDSLCCNPLLTLMLIRMYENSFST